jgi:hypothetical protein
MSSGGVGKVGGRFLKVEFLTAVTMMSTIIWDVMPCSLVGFYQHFRGACCIYL